MDLQSLKQKMDEAHYIYDETLATVLAVALALGRPLLIEGAAGVGKTEVAKVLGDGDAKMTKEQGNEDDGRDIEGNTLDLDSSQHETECHDEEERKIR